VICDIEKAKAIIFSFHFVETVEERDTMLRALKQSENLFSRYYLNEEFNDLQFDFALRDDIIIGSPFNVTVIVKNKSIDTVSFYTLTT